MWGLLAIALIATACGPKDCAGTVYESIVPGGPMKPGQTRHFTVYTVTNDPGARADETHPAGGAWVWTASGPTPSEPRRADGDSCDWTAPAQEGDYVIYAVGKTPNNDKAQQLRLDVKVEAAAPQEFSQEKPAPSKPPAVKLTPVKVFEVGNVYGIKAGAKAPSFALSKPAVVTMIQTYHYIAGGGPAPGTIGLKAADGTVYGPWKSAGSDGQGGVKNAFWTAVPNAEVPAGTYTIVDSSPGTWSSNGRAKGLGFVTVMAAYK